jgi:hypothetical protein
MIPIDRRTALTVVASILSRGQAQAQEPTRTCTEPETLVLNLGSGACSVKQIRVQQGAVSATIPVSELLQALGAKLGGHD